MLTAATRRASRVIPRSTLAPPGLRTARRPRAARPGSPTAPGEDVQPRWSADGNKIAFASGRDGNYEIYVMAADGSNPTRLTDNAAYDSVPDWQPLCPFILNATDNDGIGGPFG